MPTYEFRCKKCGRRFERTLTFDQRRRRAKAPCPRCKSSATEQVPACFQAVTSKKA